VQESLRCVLRHHLLEADSPIPHITSEVVIRDAKPNEIPKKLIHTTHTPEMARSIEQNGFDLKRFGYTGRKFKTPNWLTQNDPTGVYTLAAESGEDKYETRPFVLLKANIRKALYMEETSSNTNSKKELSALFGGKTKAALRKALLRLGYDAVLRKGSEQIILNPQVLTVIAVGNAE
jgi:hypothetical protein